MKIRDVTILAIVTISVLSVAKVHAGVYVCGSLIPEFTTAGTFAILSGSDILAAGANDVQGNVGSLSINGTNQLSPDQVMGNIDLGDDVSTIAMSEFAAQLANYSTFGAATIGSELGGQTLTAGVYQTNSNSATLNGVLLLDALGNPNAQFVIQSPGTLTTQDASAILLINGADVCNVYFTAALSISIGQVACHVGNFWAQTSITVGPNSHIDGRLMAVNGPVTLNSISISLSMPS